MYENSLLRMQFTLDDQSQRWAKTGIWNDLGTGEKRRNPIWQSNKISVSNKYSEPTPDYRTQAGQLANKSALSAFWFTMLRRGREEALGGRSSVPTQPIGTHCGALAPCAQGAQQPQAEAPVAPGRA